MERSKGKVEVGLGDGNDSLFSKSPHQNKASANGNLVAICYKENAITNAEHLIECWNAFEKGGLVEQLQAELGRHKKAMKIALDFISPEGDCAEQAIRKEIEQALKGKV